MSGPLNLTPDQIGHLADFMRAVSKATRETGVQLAPYGRTELMVGTSAISFSWNGELNQYILDDRVGE